MPPRDVSPAMNVWTYRQLVAAGTRRRDIDRLLATGRLIRARRGMYVDGSAPGPVVEAVRVGGRVAYVTALEVAGVWVDDRHRPHIHLDRSASRCRSPRSHRERLTATNRSGVRLHWGGLVFGPTASAVHPVDAVIQAVRCQRFDSAIATVDSAVNSGLISEHDLAIIGAKLPDRLRKVIDMVDGRCESGLESRLRLLLRSAGLPFEVQAPISGVGRVDFLIAGRLVVEADGAQFHQGHALVRDYERDLGLAQRGYLVIRVNYRQLMDRPQKVLQAILAAFANVRQQ